MLDDEVSAAGGFDGFGFSLFPAGLLACCSLCMCVCVKGKVGKMRKREKAA